MVQKNLMAVANREEGRAQAQGIRVGNPEEEEGQESCLCRERVKPPFDAGSSRSGSKLQGWPKPMMETGPACGTRGRMVRRPCSGKTVMVGCLADVSVVWKKAVKGG